MKVRVAVPRRADGGRRDQLWAFCRQWWADNHPDFEIVEGHHDDGPFNRAAAINRAATGDWDVLLVADADVLASPDQITTAISAAAKTGRAALAYRRYVGLNVAMTEQILAGYDGSWEPGAKLKMETHVSSLVAVPRGLWDDIGGFDERFEGWGHEDLAFAAACRVLGGGLERIDGTVWHLWHEPSPERDKRRPEHRAGAALLNRYLWAVQPVQMRQLLDEATPDQAVVLVVITDGRRACITETIPAAEKMLTGLPIARRVICDDSGDPDYQAWLRLEFPNFDLVYSSKRTGFGRAVRRAWDTALSSGQPWCFWLEDDFVIDREVELAAMARVLEQNPHVLQMALRRQAWFPAELDAGGVIEQHPDDYEDHVDIESRWLEHRLFWTTNPHLVSRRVLAAHTWPDKNHSEAVFARQALTGNNRCGYWGSRTDEPWVTHTGERAGTGY